VDVRLVSDGDVLEAGRRRFQLIWTPGHHRGHLCAFDPESGLLLSGDRVLRIPTQIRLLSESDEDPLGEHLRSYDVLQALRVREVLPGHGRAFADARAALEEDRRAHLEDIRAVLEAVPRAGADALTIARRALLGGDAAGEPTSPLVEMRALGRSLAVLRLLERTDLVRSDDSASPIRFVRVGAGGGASPVPLR
jgi:glyoxylase-like metal-dependent hydrolase (beta-lactamase superfamily II)